MNDEYQSSPKLAALAFDLEALNRRLLKEDTAPAEIRAYLKGFADARLGAPPELPTGVTRTRNGKRFEARLNRNGNLAFFATFDTPEEASEAYQREKQHIEIHGQPKPRIRSRIRHEGQEIHLGYFETQAEADEACHAKRRELLGDEKANKLKGVIYPRIGKRYGARIDDNGTSITIGYFDTEQEAHEAYKQKHVEIHGARSPYFNEEVTA